MEFNEL